MKNRFHNSVPLNEWPLWEKTETKRVPFSFELEVTGRCNNNCRHCTINLPAGDRAAKGRELSLKEIAKIVDKAVSMGALWGLITGGEPFLREDFADIYLHMKRRGLLVSVFTNGTLVSEEHVNLFKHYPPRDLEVTVYGVTRETYEKVTRKAGSFEAFTRGLDLLLESGIPVRLKAMALRSNFHEIPAMAQLCRESTKDFFRLDPFLHLRYDGNTERNEEIRAERLSPGEIASLEASDPERLEALQQSCKRRIAGNGCNPRCDHLFQCGAGLDSFNVSFDGIFRLCPSLWHPGSVYDLKVGGLKEAWEAFVPKVREGRTNARTFLESCRICPIADLCLWCPGNAHLETGLMDGPVDYFCRVAHERARLLKMTSVG